jgi:hypothetical protein
MDLETKFLRLRTPVTIGSRFGEWEVTWLGGWTRHRLSYLVMVARIGTEEAADANPRNVSPGAGGNRGPIVRRSVL